jgi:hypothetical protein
LATVSATGSTYFSPGGTSQLADLATAQEWMSEAVRYVATAHGTPGKYHETLTLAWTRIVAAHADLTGRSSFEDLLVDFPSLLDRDLPERHWSRDLLWSEDARSGWREPDLQPLP